MPRLLPALTCRRLLCLVLYGMAAASLAAEPPVLQSIEAIRPNAATRIEMPLRDYNQSMGAERRNAWRVLYWDHGSVTLQAFAGFAEQEGPMDWERPEATPRFAVPKVSGHPLMIWRGLASADHSESVPLPLGRLPGRALKLPIREGMAHSFSLHGRKWTLRADTVKSPQGKILPGSTRLTLAEGTASTGKTVLDRTPGHFFRELEVLWAGHLSAQHQPDFLIHRTLLTGEEDFILSLATPSGEYVAGGVTVDPDTPSVRTVARVDEVARREWLRANAPRPYAVYTLPTPVLPKPAAAPLGWTLYANPPEDSSGNRPKLVAGIKRDLTFHFNDDTYRLVAELRPVYGRENQAGPVVESDLYFGAYDASRDLSLVVTAFHKGQSQVLLVTQALMDEGSMHLVAGDLDGSGALSLSINWIPHFNNSMTLVFKRHAETGRLFRRIAITQTQG